MVRNEARRFLPSILAAWRDFADGIIALDDGSTDDTRALLEGDDIQVLEGGGGAAWGAEAGPRQRLFEAVLTSDADWVLWLDADMVPASSPRPLLTDFFDGISFRLFDLWEPARYRADTYWQAHLTPRVWAVRNPGREFKAEWSGRGVHCGHLPLNLPLERVALPPLEYSLLHYGYSNEEARRAAAARYAAVESQLTGFEIDHARSILDPTPRLFKLPIDPTWAVHYEGGDGACPPAS